MLNYIWAGLIITSLVFASVQDTKDLVENTYQNGVPQKVFVTFPANANLQSQQRIQFKAAGMDTVLSATWDPAGKEAEIIIPVTKKLPQHWQTVADNYDTGIPQQMRVHVVKSNLRTDQLEVMLPAVKFVKLRAISKAAFDMADFAVKLAIGLIGIMALWLGLMRIAEKSGMIHVLVKVVNPVLRFIFPEIPKDHPALGAISLNIAANMLGLGNAATPFGIKAMEELQKLNPDKNKATNAMCMFLTINTASVQIVPPVTLIAIMGLRIGNLYAGILLATGFSLIIGIIAAKWYARRFPDTPLLTETEA